MRARAAPSVPACTRTFANFSPPPFLPPPTPSPQVGAVEAFAALEFIAYTSFNFFCYLYRDTLLPPPMSSQNIDNGLPPAQFGGDGGYGGTQYAASGGASAYRDEPAGAPATVL